MKKFVLNQDRIFSIIVFIFSILMFWQTQTTIKPMFTGLGGSDPGSRAFPYALSVIMAICSIGKFIKSNQPDKTPFLGGKKTQLTCLAALVSMAIYVFAFEWLGFFIATFALVTVLVLLLKRDNKPRWYAVVLFSAIVTVALYLCFSVLLQVYFTTGELWNMIL